MVVRSKLVLILATACCLIPTFAASANVKMAPKAAVTPAAPIVRMQTVKGLILIKLFPKEAPISSANFEKLVRKGFYNGLTFWRIADIDPATPSRIVQGGDPAGDGSGGPGYTIKGEFPSNGVNNPLKHNRGAVAMARAQGNDTAGSQFYICAGAPHYLDGNYAVFGQVIKGMSIVDKLAIGDKMTKVTMEK